MAKIFDKTSSVLGTDKTLLLDQREALVYPIPHDDWEILYVGFFISVTNGTQDNALLIPPSSSIQYVTNVLSPKDRIYVGMKPVSNKFPGEGEPYIGATQVDEVSYAWFDTGVTERSRLFSNDSQTRFGNGVIHSNNSKSYDLSSNCFYLPGVTYMNGSTGYALFVGYKFTINNKGTSGQTITIGNYRNVLAEDNEVPGTADTSDQKLKELLLDVNYSFGNPQPFHSSGVPYASPNALFAYLPFAGLRLRIHNMGVIKVK